MNIDEKYLKERLASLKERYDFFIRQSDQARANAIACDGAMKDTQEMLDYLAKEEPKVVPDVPAPEGN